MTTRRNFLKSGTLTGVGFLGAFGASMAEAKERQITANGLTSRVVAEHLSLSERTVRGHRQNLLKKFKERASGLS